MSWLGVAKGIWKKNQQLVFLLLVGFLVRAAWLKYTDYVAEDAFITFRFAQNVAEGQGFVYNPGQPIYGTTTPLFTLLMSVWTLIWKDPVPGARFFNLLASLGALAFTYQGLEAARFSPAQRVITLSILILSPRLWHLDTNGMETPLVLFFMAASWLTLQRKRWAWTGVLVGLILWVRIDTIVWVLIMTVAAFRQGRQAGMMVLGLSSATYLPWLLFAFTYFGTPIPMTIIAKYWAYGVRGQGYTFQYAEPTFSMVLARLKPFVDVLKGSTPYNLSPRAHFADAVTTSVSVFLTAAGFIYALRKRLIYPVLGFFAFEIVRLGVFKITFFNRYFVATIWSVCILSGCFLGSLWDGRSRKDTNRKLLIAILTSIFLLCMGQTIRGAPLARNVQRYRHRDSLQAIGQWLRQNMPEGTTVQLEPLGYIGYFSRLTMLDEVGLVTPEFIHLKQENVSDPVLILKILQPDAFVIHCDDAQRIMTDTAWLESNESLSYDFMVRFDPLSFQITSHDSLADPALARASCYEVWGHPK